jgi:hypothetical protein
LKFIITLAFISLLHGCASTSNTAISYSPYFKLKIPTKDLIGATFFQADSVSVKFTNSSVLSGLIIDKDLESLPSDFDIYDYPEYSLGLKSSDNLPKPHNDLFKNSWEEIKRTYNNPKIQKTERNNKTIFTACGNNACLSFLINRESPEHILMLSGINIKPSNYNKLLKGI